VKATTETTDTARHPVVDLGTGVEAEGNDGQKNYYH